ncbi:MAG TPA: glycosyltransferase family 4 protein, partial [Rubricoccaceae bacterium]
PVFVQAEARGVQRPLVGRVVAVFALGTAVFSAAVWVYGPWILHVLYDGKYDAYAGHLWMVALLPLVLAVSNVAQAALRAQERPEGVFAARAAAGGVAATVGAAAVYAFGVAGALASDLASASTEAAIMLGLIYRGRPRVAASGGHDAGRGADPARRHVLVGAFACGPGRGSEPGQGWQVASRLAQRHDVTALVYSGFQPVIEAELAVRPVPGLRFVYYHLPFEAARHHARGEERHGFREQLHYIFWSLGARRLVRRLHEETPFALVHHASLMRYWSSSPVVAARGVPFLWGPVGGGETAPPPFVRAMAWKGRLRARLREAVREASHALPAVRETARRATVGLAATDESAARMRRLGATAVETAPASVALDEKDADRLGQIGPPPEGPFTALFVGRLLDWKGVDLGLRAFAQACSDARDEGTPEMDGARFVVVGDGAERDRLQSLARSLGVAADFRGAVPRPEALAALEGAHVFVHPSLHDSGGYATLEALAAGRPVVCLTLGGPGVQVGPTVPPSPEVGVAAAAHTPEQAVADMAAALRRLAADPSLRARMGAAGRARVAAHFRWPLVVARTA